MTAPASRISVPCGPVRIPPAMAKALDAIAAGRRWYHRDVRGQIETEHMTIRANECAGEIVAASAAEERTGTGP